MSDRHGVAFVKAKKVADTLISFGEKQALCEKKVKDAIDLIISSYEPSWWQELTGKWDKMSRPSKIYYLKTHKYHYWKWSQKISEVTGVLTFDEVYDYMHGTDVRLWKELGELYDASESGDLEVGHEYATFINKWSENAT